MISVISANYNNADKLKQTIDSVLDQTYQDIELIIIDDGSSDVSLSFLKSIDDPRFKLVINSENIGLTASLIKGVDLASGEFIARIDIGDFWRSDKLELQLNFLSKNPDYILCGSQVLYYMNDKSELSDSWFSVEDVDIRKKFLSHEGIFEHSSILFRKGLNYRPFFRYSQDLDLYVRAAMNGKLYCLDTPLVYSEINEEGITMNKKYLQRQYQSIAYRNYLSLSVNNFDILNGNSNILEIRDTFVDQFLNKLSIPFFKIYVKSRTNKGSFIIWSSALFISLIIYPPYMMDYLYKLYGKIRS